MPRIVGELNKALGLQERIFLMNSLETMTDELRASSVISDAVSSFRRYVTETLTLHIGEKVWFHRKRYGRRPGTISIIKQPTIFLPPILTNTSPRMKDACALTLARTLYHMIYSLPITTTQALWKKTTKVNLIRTIPVPWKRPQHR